MNTILATFLVLSSLGQASFQQWRQLQCKGRIISERYFNNAEGFSLAIPSGLRGRTGQDDGPERGVSIPLSPDCNGVVVVYGEPNSLEWSKPADSIKWEVDSAVEDDPQSEIQQYKTRLGKLKAAGVTIRHRANFEVMDRVVALCLGGGQVYTAILSTTKARYKKDHNVFRKVLRGFRLESWR